MWQLCKTIYPAQLLDYIAKVKTTNRTKITDKKG